MGYLSICIIFNFFYYCLTVFRVFRSFTSLVKCIPKYFILLMVESLGFSIYSILSCVTVLFSINLDAFSFFYHLMSVASIFKTMLNKWQSGHAFLFQVLKETLLSFPLLSMMLGLAYGLYYVEVYFLYFVENLYHKLMLNFVICCFLHLLR